MEYTFDLIGVAPVLSLFNQQQKSEQRTPWKGAAYLGAYHCTLDEFIDSAKTVTAGRGWDLDEAVDTVVSFWVNNGEKIRHWKQRLQDAGSNNLLVGRLADVHSLRIEFESLLGSDDDTERWDDFR